MTLHRLAIRTKKSLSGLYSPNKEKECGLAPPSNNPRETASNPTITPTKTNCSPRDEFGLLRSDDDISPSGKGSPSRRHRILGSLRSMRSLRTLRVTHNSFKKSEEEPTVSGFPQTPIRATPSVLLNFEASPADEPMFGSMTRTASCSSSLRVHHSSPITVPAANRNATSVEPESPSMLGILVGTVPDSPAPLQRASVQETIIKNAVKPDPVPVPSDLELKMDPLPTPMPGTNLSFDDLPAPNILVTSPSAPSMYPRPRHGYFDDIVSPDEDEYERTKTLDTESGFPFSHPSNSDKVDPSTDDSQVSTMSTDQRIVTISLVDVVEASIAGSGSVTPHTCPGATLIAFVPEVEVDPLFVDAELDPSSFDEPFGAVPGSSDILARLRGASSSSDYGDGFSYVVYDRPDAAQCMKEVRNTSGDHSITLVETEHASGSSSRWTDETEAAYTDTTELTTVSTSSEHNAPAEAKLLAALRELDGATISARVPPVDNEKELQDIVRAYARLREGTGSDDDQGSVAIEQRGATQEIQEEVETSIRLMNRSLGG